MKNNIFNRLLFFGIVILLGLTSCEKMMDIHKEYTNFSEKVYLTKPDSVVTFAGNLRAQIRVILNNAFNVNSIVVYWNEHQDSALFQYAQKNETDTVTLEINNLEEKAHNFEIYSKNSEGNRSIKVSAFAVVYGEMYRTYLIPRNLTTIFKGVATFVTSESLECGTEMHYMTNFKNDTSIFIKPDKTATTKVTLKNFTAGTEIRYRSLFKPETTAIDTFYSDYKTFK